MSHPYSIVDAFTNQPFAGNPAAVLLLPEAAPAAWMQLVAREMNLSETAFLVRRADGFDLRWFTPAAEVDLCGHATLASAHTLWESGVLAADAPALFHTQSGLLTARRQEEWIELDFPARHQQPAALPAGVQEALGVSPRYVGRFRDDWLVLLESEAAVRETRPNHSRLRELPARGIIVTAAASTTGFDFVTRFFGPGVGIDEDPVTGSAHCCLAPYWAFKLGRDELTALQVSSRGGMLRLRMAGARVKISGKAVTVGRGQLLA